MEKVILISLKVINLLYLVLVCIIIGLVVIVLNW
jgi:hypothetical protein